MPPGPLSGTKVTPNVAFQSHSSQKNGDKASVDYTSDLDRRSTLKDLRSFNCGKSTHYDCGVNSKHTGDPTEILMSVGCRAPVF